MGNKWCFSPVHLSCIHLVLKISCQPSEGGSVALSWWHLSCWRHWILLVPTQYADMLSAAIFRNSKMKLILTIWSSLKLLSISGPKWVECLHLILTEIYRTFMAALFITGRIWKQPRCPWEVNGHIDWAPFMQQDVLQLKRHEIWSHQETSRGAFSAYYSLEEANLEKWQSSGYQLPRTFPKRQTMKRVKSSLHSQEFVAELRGWGNDK